MVADFYTHTLGQTIERAMTTFQVPGIAVAVIKDDDVVYQRGHGVVAIDDDTPVDEQTIFGIGSNSKAFVAAALAILVERGELTWQDKVVQFLPDFQLYDPYVTAEFTVADLLTHRSGLGLGAGDLMEFPIGADFTREDVVHNLRYFKPTSSFRSEFAYDNQLYIVAGEIIAQVSGMSWEAFVTQEILAPLEMTDSAASQQTLSTKHPIASHHAQLDDQLQIVDGRVAEIANAAGGMVSNLTDMVTWVRVQLNGGQHANGQLFSEATRDKLWAPHTLMPLPPNAPYRTHFLAYALGWFVSDVNGYQMVTHTGGIPGMVTQVTMLPEQGLGIIVLTNQQQGDAFQAITQTILDQYLAVDGIDRVSERQTLLNERVQVAQKIEQEVADKIAQNTQSDAGDFTALAGRYTDAWFGDVTLEQAPDGTMTFTAQRSPGLTGEMTFYQDNTYIVRWHDRSLNADAFVTFERNEKGEVLQMTMAAISPLTDFSFDFQDLLFHPAA